MASQAPPAYDASSVTDHISELIGKALVLQESLNKARSPVTQIDAVVGSKFSAPLSEIDESFVNLLADSRLSAATLAATIDYFVNAVVPMAKDISIPISRRYETVQNSAEQIAQSANEHFPSIQNGVENVRGSLHNLHQRISEVRERQLNDSFFELDRANNEIYTIALKIKGHPKVYAKLSKASKEIVDGIKKPAAGAPGKPSGNAGDAPGTRKATVAEVLGVITGVHLLYLFFTMDVEAEKNRPILDTKVAELGLLRDNIEKKNAQLENVARKTTELVLLIDDMASNIGNFGVIWNKLVSDSEELKAYLDSSGTAIDEAAFIERVEAELLIYANIKGTLEDYCLQV